MKRASNLFVTAVVAMAGSALLAAQATPGGGQGTSRPGQSTSQRSTRDTPAQQAADADTPKGHITGRVLAADSGRPIRRARVFLSGAAIQGGRATLTDNDGVFDLTELPEGRYTLTAGKVGFISLSYGQRRPLQTGIPIQLADGQALTGLDFRLPRGSVIAGHVYDETGDPLPGAAVRVMRYEYAQGSRQLTPVGAAQTDDLGAYRIWGLNPGEYYVSAVMPNAGGRGGFAPPPGPPGGGRFGGPGGRGGPVPGGAPEDPNAVGYAPTYYPGVPSVAEARAVAVGLSAEVPSIDFGVLLVRTARVSGRVANPDGSDVTAGNVTMVPENGGRIGRGGNIGGTFGARIEWDGAFSMSGVAPGRYILRARSDDSVEPQFAVQPLTVGDTDLTNLTVILAAAASVSGTVSFETSQGQQLPDPASVRVSAPVVDGIDIGPNPVARVERTGAFTLNGLPAGAHLFRPQGNPRGWVLKSVLLNGRDITDSPVELRAGQTLTGLSVVFTDRLTEVNGTITDDRNSPVTEYTVLAFPEDQSLWRAQARQIMTTRPDQNGRYQIRGLPPGRYYLVAVDPAEQGEWFEPTYLSAHVSGATSVSLADGDVKTQDFKLRVQ
ncbi:MAG: carboxypeptidase-like regulatory domain-containing protein [Vicinamibacterales bacterium]